MWRLNLLPCAMGIRAACVGRGQWFQLKAEATAAIPYALTP
jgi:hypothetical protein